MRALLFLSVALLALAAKADNFSDSVLKLKQSIQEQKSRLKDKTKSNSNEPALPASSADSGVKETQETPRGTLSETLPQLNNEAASPDPKLYDWDVLGFIDDAKARAIRYWGHSLVGYRGLYIIGDKGNPNLCGEARVKNSLTETYFKFSASRHDIKGGSNLLKQTPGMIERWTMLCENPNVPRIPVTTTSILPRPNIGTDIVWSCSFSDLSDEKYIRRFNPVTWFDVLNNSYKKFQITVRYHQGSDLYWASGQQGQSGMTSTVLSGPVPYQADNNPWGVMLNGSARLDHMSRQAFSWRLVMPTNIMATAFLDVYAGQTGVENYRRWHLNSVPAKLNLKETRNTPKREGDMYAEHGSFDGTCNGVIIKQ